MNIFKSISDMLFPTSKLVRDYIPDIIREDGKICSSRSCSSVREFRSRLRDKMLEELEEFMEDPTYEEAADMYEVLRAFANLHELNMLKILTVANDKRNERGGFDDGIILEGVKK